MADAVPVHKPQNRAVDPDKDLQVRPVVEDELKAIPAEFQKAARRALEDGHTVSILGEGRAIRIDKGYAAGQ